ncbi:MAG: hypothetical protein AAFW75_25555 [Cyanobacteria bacterium J06636_16]
MELSPKLQKAITAIAAQQGVSPEQFIVQTLTEKVKDFQQPQNQSAESPPTFSHHESRIRDMDSILVIETAPLDHIDFNNLIEQLRVEREQELLSL